MIDWTTILGALALGLAAGVLGGMFGIGGGLVMVPAMVLFFQFSTKTATGTSLLAQVLPVGLLGVINYHRMGHMRFGFGLSMALGLFVGIFFGSRVAGLVSQRMMKRLYAVFLLAVALYMLVSPQGVKERAAAAPAPPAGDGQPARDGSPS